MAIRQKSTNSKCWSGCGEKGMFLHCWWECKLVQPLWRTVWRFLRTLNIELPSIFPTVFPHLGTYVGKAVIQKNTNTPMFIARTWKQPKQLLTDEWNKKIWYKHTMEYYSAIKKNEIMPFSRNVDATGDSFILSKVSQKEKDI